MKKHTDLQISLATRDHECVLTILTESLTHDEAPEIASSILEMLRHDHPDARRVVVDFSRVVHVNSNAVSVLLLVRNNLERGGCELVLRNVSPEIRELFRFLCLEKVLPIIEATHGKQL